jgi:hypothetical protein
MIKVLGENYYVDLDEIENYLDMSMKGASNTSIPFRIAFNSLLNKKLINHY